MRKSDAQLPRHAPGAGGGVKPSRRPVRAEDKAWGRRSATRWPASSAMPHGRGLPSGERPSPAWVPAR